MEGLKVVSVADGVEIQISQFKKLNVKEQNAVMFQNMQEILKKFDNHQKDYSLHKKLFWWFTGLMASGLMTIAAIVLL